MIQNQREVFAAAGMVPGKTLTFSSIDKAVDIVGRFATDTMMNGRVMAILPEPEGCVDLEDDEEGLWGGAVFKECQERMRARGNII
jgi:hypothetical protein